MNWWWLSFADPRRPKGTQLLGVVVVWADSFEGAVAETRIRSLNPGGEVEGREIPADLTEIPEVWRNKLLSPANAKALVTWTERMWKKR